MAENSSTQCININTVEINTRISNNNGWFYTTSLDQIFNLVRLLFTDKTLPHLTHNLGDRLTYLCRAIYARKT